MVMPVVEELLHRGHEAMVLGLTTAGRELEAAGLPHKRPIDYLNVNEPMIRRFGEMLAKRHHTTGKGMAIEESIAYLGISYCDLVRDVGEEIAAQLYQIKGLNAFCPVHFARIVLKEESPDIVVATTSPRMEMAILRAAFNLNIPSICMVDLFGILEIDWLRRSDNGDFLAVYSEKVKRRLVAGGRPASRIFITGNPAFDRLGDPSIKTEAEKVRGDKGVLKTDKLIVWAEQPEPANPDLPRLVRNHLNDICSRHPGWRFVVRLHPSSTDASKEVMPEGSLQSHSHEPLGPLIASADLIITLTSTVAMEALLSDTGVLILKLSQYSNMVDYTEEDGAFIVSRLEDAEKAMGELLSNSSTAARLAERRRALPAVGGAARRVCDLIESQVVRDRVLS